MRRLFLTIFAFGLLGLSVTIAFAQSPDLFAPFYRALEELTKRVRLLEEEVRQLKSQPTGPVAAPAAPLPINLATAVFKIAADSPPQGTQIIKGSPDVLLAAFTITNTDTNTDVYLEKLTFLCQGCPDAKDRNPDITIIRVSDSNGRGRNVHQIKEGPLFTTNFTAGELTIPRNGTLAISFRIDTANVGGDNPRGITIEIKEARILTPVEKVLTANLPIASPTIALIPQATALPAASAQKMVAYCYVKSDSSPIYTGTDPYSGFAKQQIVKDATNIEPVKQLCAYAYDNLIKTYCSRMPTASYRRGVLLVNEATGNFFSNCDLFGCKSYSCPETTAPAVTSATTPTLTAPTTQISSGGSSIAAATANASPTAATISGSGGSTSVSSASSYCAGGTPGPANTGACSLSSASGAYDNIYYLDKPGINDLTTLKSVCTNADYTALLQKACTYNPSFSGQEGLITRNANGCLYSSTCGPFGCGNRTCAQLSNFNLAVEGGACLLAKENMTITSITYQSPDSGSGYAKRNILGKDFAEVKAKCTDDIYKNLLTTICANNTNLGSMAKEVILFDSKGSGVTYGGFLERVFCPTSRSGGLLDYFASIFKVLFYK